MRTKNDPLTPKQLKVKEIMIKEIGKSGKRKSKEQILLEAGYSPTQAKRPTAIFNSPNLKRELKPYLDNIDDKRRQVLSHITDEKLSKSSARDLAYVLSVLNHDHQLLSGQATDRIEKKESLSDLFDEIERKKELAVKKMNENAIEASYTLDKKN